MARRGIGHLMASVEVYAGFMALLREPTANRSEIFARYDLDDAAYTEVRDHWCVRLAESPKLDETFREAFASARADPSTIEEPRAPESEDAEAERVDVGGPALAAPAPRAPLPPARIPEPASDDPESSDMDSTGTAKAVASEPMPFGGAPSAAFLEALGNPTRTLVEDVNQTSEVRALDDMPPSTPFEDAAVSTELSVTQYASLLVELDYFRDHRALVCRRYGMLEEEVQKLQQQWAAKLRSQPSLAAELETARSSYLAYLLEQGAKQPR